MVRELPSAETPHAAPSVGQVLGRHALKIVIDKAKCEGTEYCVRIAPEAFRLGPDDKAEALRQDFGPAESAMLREAEQTCPTSAIRVHEDEGASS